MDIERFKRYIKNIENPYLNTKQHTQEKIDLFSELREHSNEILPKVGEIIIMEGSFPGNDVGGLWLIGEFCISYQEEEYYGVYDNTPLTKDKIVRWWPISALLGVK